MFEINTIQNTGDDSSLLYKVLKGFLICLSALIFLFYVAGIANYISSGPTATLLDDITLDFAVIILLLGFSLVYLVGAWFRHISYGIISIIFTGLYVLYLSIINGKLSVGFLPIILVVNAFGFIILGLVKKHKKKRDYNVFAEPIVDEYEGPDVFNFKV
ncbi:MAG: hypothetical protein AB1Z23_10280 [Eubacteriales bacterium]